MVAARLAHADVRTARLLAVMAARSPWVAQGWAHLGAPYDAIVAAARAELAQLQATPASARAARAATWLRAAQALPIWCEHVHPAQWAAALAAAPPNIQSAIAAVTAAGLPVAPRRDVTPIDGVTARLARMFYAPFAALAFYVPDRVAIACWRDVVGVSNTRLGQLNTALAGDIIVAALGPEAADHPQQFGTMHAAVRAAGRRAAALRTAGRPQWVSARRAAQWLASATYGAPRLDATATWQTLGGYGLAALALDDVAVRAALALRYAPTLGRVWRRPRGTVVPNAQDALALVAAYATCYPAADGERGA